MSRWCAGLAALLLPFSAGVAAEDVTGAARELARKTAAFAGRGEPVSISWRSLSNSGTSDLHGARSVFEAELRDRGSQTGDSSAAVEAQITASENATRELLVEEIRKGDDREVWIVSWPRPAAAERGKAAITLDQKLIWESQEPILDVLVTPDALAVLTTAHITWLELRNGQWTPTGSVNLPVVAFLRDPRGRIRLSGGGFVAYLPGVQCQGTLQVRSPVDCKASEDAWVLESGSRAMLLAWFAPNRNFFDGRIVTQTGARKTIAPFFSAAAVEQQGAPVWLLAGLDGRVQVADAALEPLGAVGPWGSDIAGVAARCAGGSQVLASRPGEALESDAVQAFGLSGRGTVPLSAPLEFPGPIRALWPAEDAKAIAVAEDSTTGRYAAYLVSVGCAP